MDVAGALRAEGNAGQDHAAPEDGDDGRVMHVQGCKLSIGRVTIDKYVGYVIRLEFTFYNKRIARLHRHGLPTLYYRYCN